MAQLTTRPMVDLKVQLELNYHEIAALDALAGYGLKSFLDVFYEKMGESYLKPHEEGLKTLFETVRKVLPRFIERFENAQQVLAGTKQVRL
jgi:hypothetical protein